MGSVEKEPMSGFRVLQSFSPDYSPGTITQYESDRTGMRVVVVDQKGPKLYGYFVLATEIHDDSGAPHTLEHLCFLGSKSYQYKGFLDKLATRAYSVTNAWTAVDHTAYTLETAGWAGFAQILPVYLEHLILPTLTEAGCITEVHHIDGSGNDAGVVYAEMQGTENTAADLMELKAKRTLYPEGVGFRYETGGILERLRELSVNRIRAFHRDMYQPKNLCLALFGDVDHEELLQILKEFEASIIEDIPSPGTPFRRPWIESRQIPPLSKSLVETVEFPEEDESFGSIVIRFLGPSCVDVLEASALGVCLQYLAGSSAALLDNVLVEKEQLASSIYYSLENRPSIEISFSLYSVETAKLEQVEKRFFEVLKDALNEDLDMSFMQDCIDSTVRTVKFQAEASSTAFADHIIADYIYGNRDGSTLENVATLKQFKDPLSNWTQEQWKSFIRKYISDAHHISLIGKPSARLSEKLKSDEAARIEEQKQRLGPDGLKKMEEKLEEAKSQNDREIPTELLGAFKVPPTDSIHFVKTASARIGPALKVGRPQNKYQKIVETDGQDMPLYLNFEHIPSNFARVHLIISTESLPIELRPLLSIYLEAFFNLPVIRDGQTIDFEQVVTELERETVGYSVDAASALGNVECLKVTFQVEIEKYSIAIRWLKELLWSSVFDIERLKAINTRLLADVPEYKRSGDDMLTGVHLMIHLAPESIGRARSTLVKALYLKRIRSLLKTSPATVVAQFEQLRAHLCKFSNLRVLVVADLDKLAQPVSSWRPFLLGLDTTVPLTSLGRRRDRLSYAGLHPGTLAYIVPMATIDSSFAQAVCSGPTSHADPAVPALMVAMSYMNAVEGPLWAAVRGKGLAYGTWMAYDLESGHLRLEVDRSPDAFKAFEASRQVVQEHIDGTIPFDPLMLEGAISGIVVGFANEQQTLASAAAANFVQVVMKGLPEDYMEVMLKKVREIEVEDIKEALKGMVYDIFTPGKADVIVTCAPGLQDAIKEGLETAGFKPEIRELSYFQDDYGVKAGADEDDESTEEDGEAEKEDNDNDEVDDDEEEEEEMSN